MLCESQPPRDLKRRSSVFSLPPFFTFTSLFLSLYIVPPPRPPALVPYYLPSALPSSPQSRTGRSVSGASRDLPRGPSDELPKYRVWIIRGTKDPQKTHHERSWTSVKMCLIGLLLTGAACTECGGHRIKVPSNYPGLAHPCLKKEWMCVCVMENIDRPCGSPERVQ